jgi:hypothetical protein
MTQEDKILLIKDLSARLPYAVTVEHTSGFRGALHDITVHHMYDENDNIYDAICYTDFFGDEDNIYIEYFKPYLFPLSSMTEEQRNEISQLLIDTQKEFSPYGELNMRGCDNLFICTVKQANVLINYCLTHHLDINGLIEKGLALDATGLNIY